MDVIDRRASQKDDMFADVKPADMVIDVQSVEDIVKTLLGIVLAFVGPEKAKTLLDATVVEAANRVADAAEDAKFGQ